MKKIMVWMIIAALALTAAGCGLRNAEMKEPVSQDADIEESDKDALQEDKAPYEAKDNTFLRNASPETSALALYLYDGTEVHREFLFETKEVEHIVKELSKVDIKESKDWTPDKIMDLIYGVEIGGKDGSTICGAWSNGYWITMEGAVFEFDYDFEMLSRDYAWESPDSFSSLTVLPCARHLMLREDRWYPKIMTPAGEKDAPAGILMTITEQKDDMLVAEITNNSGDEWFFGEYFSLEVNVEDAWYQVPTTPGNWTFHDIGLVLPSKESMEMEYYLKMYGDLPAGTYRLVVEGMTAEFEIEE